MRSIVWSQFKDGLIDSYDHFKMEGGSSNEEPLISKEDQSVSDDNQQDDDIDDYENELNCYNMYLLIDEVNDGAIAFNEISNSCLKDKDGLLNQWEQHFGKKQKVQPPAFHEFMVKNVTEDEVVQMLDKQYRRSIRGCGCFAYCCKDVRNGLIEDEFFRYKSLTDPTFLMSNPAQKFKKQVVFFILNCAKVYSYFSKLADFIGNCLILWVVYRQSRDQKHLGNIGYLYVIVINLICALSTFLICYSSMLNMAFSEGLYEPESIQKASFFQKTLRIIFLSCFGPLFPVIITSVSLVEYTTYIFLLICGNKGFDLVERSFKQLYKSLFGLSKSQIAGLEAQSAIAQLLFQTLPMLILKICMVFGYPDLELDEEYNKNGATLVAISFGFAFLNVFNTFFKIWVTSKSLQEPFILYTLNCLKAQHGWIPFNHLFKRGDQLALIIDYSQIKIKFPLLTNMTGFYKKMNYQFESASLLEFSTQIVLYSNNLLTTDGLQKADGPPTYEPILAVQAPLEKTLFEKIPEGKLRQYREQFDKLDTDKNGFIEKQELLTYIKKQRDDDQYEGGNDNESNGSQNEGTSDNESDKREVEKFLNEFDQNKDGKVSFKEFATVLAKDDGIDERVESELDKDQQEEPEDEEKETFYQIADKLSIGESLERITLNQVVHTYDITRLPGIDVNFSGVDWVRLYENSLDQNQIFQSALNNNKRSAFTISGKPCLWVCVEMEPTYQQKQYNKPFDLKECMQLLLKNDIDTDIIDYSGETLLIHAIKTYKQISIDLLIDAGTDIHQQNQNKMTPLGQSIMDSRFEISKKLIDKGAKVNEKCILDSSVSKKLCSPIEYVAKKMRKQKQFVESKQANRFMQIFQSIDIKAEHEDERIAIFQYLSYCFTQSNFPHYLAISLKNKFFPDLDIISFKDKNGQNFAHQLAKNWSDKNTIQSNLERELYDFTKQESALGEQFWIEDDSGQSPIVALIKSEKYENERHLTIVSNSMVVADTVIKDEKNQKIVLDFFNDKLKRFSEQGKNKLFEITQELEKKNLSQYFINEEVYDKMMSDFEKQATYFKNPIRNTTNNQNISEIQNDVDQQMQEPIVEQKNEQKDKSHESEKDRIIKQPTKAFSSSLILQQEDMIQTQKLKQSGIEVVFKYLIEVVGFCDLIGDLYCLKIYIIANHYAWASLTIFQMLSPFFVSYVPLVNYWIHLGSFGIYQQGKNKSSKMKQIFGYMALFPIFLVYLTMMDILYLIETVFLHPISVLLSWISCGCISFTLISDVIESLYKVFFDMGENDIEGFRRLRTISQLLFESIPQIMLQLRMMHYFLVEHYNPEELDRLGINTNAILLSLLFAVIHVVIEMQFLVLDAKACKTTKMHYIIICLNGRFGWVPFTHKFLSSTSNSQEQCKFLDYDDIQSTLCSLRLKVFFKFDESTCENLIKAISSLPLEQRADKRIDISIGKCMEEVSFDKLLNLLDIAHQRVNFNIENLNIRFMIEQSSDYLTPVTAKNAEITPEMQAKWDQILRKMVAQGYYFMVMTLVKLGVKFDDENAALFFKIAMENKDKQMIKVLLRMNNKKILEESYISLKRFIKTVLANNENTSQYLLKAIEVQKNEDLFAKVHGADYIQNQLVKLDSQVSQNLEQIDNFYYYLFMTYLGNLSCIEFLEFMKEQVRKINAKTIEIKMKSGWYIDGFVFCNYKGQEFPSRENQGGDWGKGLILPDDESCIKIEQWKDRDDHLMRAFFTMSNGRTFNYEGEKHSSRDKKVETFEAPEGKFIASVAQTGYCGPITSAIYEDF